MIIFNALQATLSGGIGRYCFELSKAIYNLDCIDFKIVIREEDELLFSFANKKDLLIVKNIKNSKERNFYEQIILPHIISKKYKNAIIHYPDTMGPIITNNRVVITVHDLAFLNNNFNFTKSTTLWKKYITNMSIRKSNKIICITNFTKQEFNKFYPDYIDKVNVVYNGFNAFSRESINANNISKTIEKIVDEKYILSVSTISPRKNIDGLIKAFNNIKNSIPHKLVIVGKNGWLYKDVFELVDKLSLNERVIFTGGVNDDELKRLYKNATLFVYPSFYEGFGLPPLEAMSYGIPCIVSNVTSIPEVVGESGIYIDPNSIEEMSNTILNTINNKIDLNDKINKGLKRILDFSWNKCAHDTIGVYTELCNDISK